MQTTSPLPADSLLESSVNLDKRKSLNFSLAALSLIVALAAWLRVSNMKALGLANHYYAAAIKSMLESWHNFFFVAAEPGGSVSVDKPPVGLWLQVISARIFGVTTLGLLLPQLVAGILSVILVYYLVNRKFGAPAGLVAALVLAITPVVVATDRNNTMDSTLIFTLLLAAWVFIKATETNRLRYLMLGALLVGIAFNIKMLEAYLPLPAFFAMYLLGAPERFWHKVAKLALTTIVLLVISFSWAVAVDLTPADQRPYVGSSGDNSELSLIIGYNGIQRLVGMFGGRGNIFQKNTTSTQADGGLPFTSRGFSQRGFQPGLPPDNGRTFPQGSVPQGFPNNNPGGFNPGPDGAVSFSSIGQAGALRLFIPPLSKETSWLLPFALISLLLLLFTGRFTWLVGRQHQAVILWGGWLITAGIFFSIASFFHEYYLSTLAPPLAALVGIGVTRIWQLSRRHLWIVPAIIIPAAALTLLLQYNTAVTFIQDLPWLPVVLGVFLIGAVILLVSGLIRHPFKEKLAQIGLTGLVVAMLITPGMWSVLTNLHSSENQSLPAAYNRISNGPANSGQIQVSTSLLNYLQTNTQGDYYLMAVPSSMQGADYILATGRPVLYLGGFMGQDNVLTVDSLASLVSEGKLRFIYWNASGNSRGGAVPLGGQSGLTTWLTGHCSVVHGSDLITFNSGAPDGIFGGTGLAGGFSGQDVVLYDCGS